jgi:vitamin B12 transporter
VIVTAGLEREESKLNTRSPSSFDPNPVPTIASVTIDAAYLQAQATPFDGLTATLGVRLSRNSRFGEAINLRATAAYSPNGGDTVLRASIGDGFKAPTPFQLLSDFGNPTLRPEDAYAFDFSLEHRAFDGALQASIGYFERIAQDQIDFVSCFGRTEPFCIGRPFGTYDNVRAARAHGVEASLAWRPIEGLRIDANVTDLRAENRSTGSAAFGKDLPRRPRQTASLGASYVFDGGAEIGASALYVGANFDDSANLRRLKSYALLMVRGSLPVTETAALYGRIENVTDEAYQTSFQYSGLPRQAVIGVRVVF